LQFVTIEGAATERGKGIFSVGAIPRVFRSYRHMILVEEEEMIRCGTHGGCSNEESQHISESVAKNDRIDPAMRLYDDTCTICSCYLLVKPSYDLALLERRLHYLHTSPYHLIHSVCLTRYGYFYHNHYRNWSILEKILRQTARRDRLVMTCSTGKPQLWDRRTLRIQEASSFWTFTSLPTILSRYVDFRLCTCTCTRTTIAVLDSV
jgi:hypothetical protein